TFGTGKVDDAKIEKAVVRSFDLRPAAIIEAFGLRRPIFSPLSAYGHMGRDELCVGWEKTDLVEKLLSSI
ncbi:MAG: methionine adenosyltransferase domain-containing protein, partial [Clostridiales bacterium]|nr:methionine adenosyltransferase domain-containing protein [Clostridiales bacterium]